MCHQAISCKGIPRVIQVHNGRNFDDLTALTTINTRKLPSQDRKEQSDVLFRIQLVNATFGVSKNKALSFNPRSTDFHHDILIQYLEY